MITLNLGRPPLRAELCRHGGIVGYTFVDWPAPRMLAIPTATAKTGARYIDDSLELPIRPEPVMFCQERFFLVFVSNGVARYQHEGER